MKIENLLTSLSRECDVSDRSRMGRAYGTITNHLYNFHGCCPTLKTVFTKEHLHRFQEKLFSAGLEHNTIVFYNSILRVAYNKAIALRQLKEIPKLFDTLHTTPVATAKRALTPLEMARIMAAELADDPILEEARDLFILCFLLQGMPFIDLMHLRKSDLSGAVINYRRRKTDSPVTVALLPQACALLRKYMAPAGTSRYLLPYITREGAAGRRQYDTLLRYYNDNLKLLGARLGFDEKLTSYCARHSWATIAHHQGIDVSVVSQGMGHQTEQITHTYLSDFGHTRLLQANETVMASSLNLIFEGLVPGISPERMEEMKRIRDENIRSLQPADTARRGKPKGMQDVLLRLLEDLKEVRDTTQSDGELQLIQDFQLKAAATLQQYIQQQPPPAHVEASAHVETLESVETLDSVDTLPHIDTSPAPVGVGLAPTHIAKPLPSHKIRPHKLRRTREAPPQAPASDPPKRKRSNKRPWQTAKEGETEREEKIAIEETVPIEAIEEIEEIKTKEAIDENEPKPPKELKEVQNQTVETRSLPPDDHTINEEINTPETEGDAKTRPKQKRIRQLVIDGFRHCKSRD